MAGVARLAKLATVSGRTTPVVLRIFPELAARRRQPKRLGIVAEQRKRKQRNVEAKKQVYAAIRRYALAGMSGRAIERKHQVGWRTVQAALRSPNPPTRKKYPRRERLGLRGLESHIDALLTGAPLISIREIWEGLLDDHHAAVTYQSVHDYVFSRRGPTPRPPLPVSEYSATMEDMSEPSGATEHFDETTAGQVILLNGVSSSGKSSLARQLQLDLEGPFFHMGIDMIGAMRSQTRTHELDTTELAEVLQRTRAGFHRAVAGMTHAGNDIIMDHVLSEPWRLNDCLTVLAGIDVVFIGVHCSADELQRREQQRGDRPIGTAAQQIESVHAQAIYDLEVDTSTDSIEDCSAQIKKFLDQTPSLRAFDQLRAASKH